MYNGIEFWSVYCCYMLQQPIQNIVYLVNFSQEEEEESVMI